MSDPILAGIVDEMREPLADLEARIDDLDAPARDFVIGIRAALNRYDTFTCPVCGRRSWNTNDARERYCGNCHGFTETPPPEGFAWVRFHGEDGSIIGRLLEERTLEPGVRYEIIGAGVYVYDGSAFAEVDR